MKHLICVGILLTNCLFLHPIKTCDASVVARPVAEPIVIEDVVEEQIEVIQVPEEKEPIKIPVSYDVEIQNIIIEVAEEYGIEPSLMLAIAEIESNGRPDAIGKTNDYGLMQINKVNHEWLEKELGITDWFDARQNTEAACYIITWLRNNYGPCAEDTSCLLMSYNMGVGGARKLWKQGIYESSYSKKVLEVERKIKDVSM